MTWAGRAQDSLLRTGCPHPSPEKSGHAHRGYLPTSWGIVARLGGICYSLVGRIQGLSGVGDTLCQEMASPDLSRHPGDPKEQRKEEAVYEESVPC